MAETHAAYQPLPLPAAALTVPGVLARLEPPQGLTAPLVVDSPHSGRHYPDDFGFAAPLDILRRAEDAFVDELFASAPRHGAALLVALFPRSYIDPNRHEHDLDTGLLGEPWPYPARPSERSARGLGLVRRLVRRDVPVYDRLLTAAEVAARIARCHRPYHDALADLIGRAHSHFGAVWHLNCHSMRSHARLSGGRRVPRADFVLGDLDGTSCDAAFTRFVAETLRDLGYSVAVNRPFKGAELVRRHGRPAEGRHSLQIEVNRGLYMDEARIEKNDRFAAVQRDMDRLLAALAAYAREACAAGALARATADRAGR
ncbi:MAG: N-formylglutamate amidohydrolase [Rhodospirillaceae bacterium]|nr:N-formylglutamate amidohydrolase [Rhodospirillaceae bacterium]